MDNNKGVYRECEITLDECREFSKAELLELINEMAKHKSYEALEFIYRIFVKID